MDRIGWGIIGCGDVTEKKSGPAFSKIVGSSLVAVMRRDAAKAADYARRHQVPRWFDQVEDLIEHQEVTAVYIATPPGSHRELALTAAASGKPCYVEKPMARSFSESLEMTAAFNKAKVPLFVAYYRRALPRFRKIQSLVQQRALGKILELRYHQSNTGNLQMASGALPWRFDPLISGGEASSSISAATRSICWTIGSALSMCLKAMSQETANTRKLRSVFP